jgi:hypothetical protein
MEKLIEELIDRLKETRKGIILELKSSPIDTDNRIALLQSGEILAYDACINELKRLVIHYKESNSKS